MHGRATTQLHQPYMRNGAAGGSHAALLILCTCAGAQKSCLRPSRSACCLAWTETPCLAGGRLCMSCTHLLPVLPAMRLRLCGSLPAVATCFCCWVVYECKVEGRKSNLELMVCAGQPCHVATGPDLDSADGAYCLYESVFVQMQGPSHHADATWSHGLSFSVLVL